MTDPNMADATYIEPITWQIARRLLPRKNRMPSCRPWRADRVNCALDLAKHGVLEKYKVEMIGATREAIDMAEDRENSSRR